MSIVTLRGLRGLGALTEGQREQAQRQFMQRVQTFDNYVPSAADESAYFALADRISAHLNAVQHLQSETSLNSWGVVGEGILSDVRQWLAVRPIPEGMLNVIATHEPPGTTVVDEDGVVLVGPELITARRRGADQPAWLYFVVGAGVLGLGGLLAWNIARRRRG